MWLYMHTVHACNMTPEVLKHQHDQFANTDPSRLKVVEIESTK